jgi:hypothetical protein
MEATPTSCRVLFCFNDKFLSNIPVQIAANFRSKKKLSMKFILLSAPFRSAIKFIYNIPDRVSSYPESHLKFWA